MSNTPLHLLPGFGQVVPTAATHMGKFGDHTSLTEEHLVSWKHIKTIYCHLTHKWIDYNIALEVPALITEESIHKAKPKPVAHYCDLVTFITVGVFGNHLLLHCPCEQLQLAVHHLIVLYCVARPGEVALTWLTTDALKYCNLEFYLMLWEDNDDDEQDDDDNELMEDYGGMLLVQGSGHEVQPSQCQQTRCHGPKCTGSMKAVGSYGRSTGTKGQVTEEDHHSRSKDGRAEARGLAGTSSRHGRGAASMETMDMEDQARMQGGPSTATRRTKLKEHADGYHSGAREIRVKGIVTGRRRRSSA
ncbi:uncharacterized protein UDID_18956 [Ustilago sp. UG-2017a]|nr:uncharacterized protein UDID_18956 [Ustilago sp. UG-2017a]